MHEATDRAPSEVAMGEFAVCPNARVLRPM